VKCLLKSPMSPSLRTTHIILALASLGCATQQQLDSDSRVVRQIPSDEYEAGLPPVFQKFLLALQSAGGRAGSQRLVSGSRTSTNERSARIRMAYAASAIDSSHLAQLQNSGFMVVNDFISSAQVAQLKDDAQALEQERRFKAAGVGDGKTNRLEEGTRRCDQCFLYPRIEYDKGGNAEARGFLYNMLDGLMQSLQQSMGIPLDALLTEGLYASYPQGGYYRRHIDSMPGTPQETRKFSYLVYLNDEWQTSDGGCLRIHTDGGGENAPAGAKPSFVDVEPRAGTLVIMRSDMPHEVLDTSAARLAIAGWFNAPDQGSSLRRKAIAVLGVAVAAKLGLNLMQQGDK